MDESRKERAIRLLKSPSWWMKEGIEPGAFIWMFLLVLQVDTAIKSNPETMFRWSRFGVDPWVVAPWTLPVLGVLFMVKLILMVLSRRSSTAGSRWTMSGTRKNKTQKIN